MIIALRINLQHEATEQEKKLESLRETVGRIKAKMGEQAEADEAEELDVSFAAPPSDVDPVATKKAKDAMQAQASSEPPPHEPDKPFTNPATPSFIDAVGRLAAEGVKDIRYQPGAGALGRKGKQSHCIMCNPPITSSGAGRIFNESA